jgi:hypothetical protein
MAKLRLYYESDRTLLHAITGYSYVRAAARWTDGLTFELRVEENGAVALHAYDAAKGGETVTLFEATAAQTRAALREDPRAETLREAIKAGEGGDFTEIRKEPPDVKQRQCDDCRYSVGWLPPRGKRPGEWAHQVPAPLAGRLAYEQPDGTIRHQPK